ncbi:hypothetical protein [Jannaschia sp. LMIT008]|uniref:hypothetical protein n=1 Tax=Jannaschia maritima TaxID=3032585 RepID=UPI002811A3B3|nr:hypothetical protein [Jannaschia sp. LMIT008]
MKRFEHEVLVFEMRTTKQVGKMRDTLRDWGQAGFEIVGVTQFAEDSPLTVFLKREVHADEKAVENAA